MNIYGWVIGSFVSMVIMGLGHERFGFDVAAAVLGISMCIMLWRMVRAAFTL